MTLRASLFAILFFTVFSCDDDDNRKPSGQFSQGVFVVNEGAFSSANSSITHYDPSTSTATQNIFSTVNNGKALGDVAQNMSIHDNIGYIVVNNSNTIEVVDAPTFSSKATISGLALPRYFTVDDGLGYVTEWVSFTDPGRVSIIDLRTNEVIGNIPVGYGAENIFEEDDLLYVSNNFENTVSVIDTHTRTVVKTITVADAPGEILEDADDKIWVVCGGSWDGNDGALVQLDPGKSRDASAQSVVKTIALGMNIAAKAALSSNGRDLFYFTGTKIYKLATSSTTAPEEPLINESAATEFYGIGVDPKTNTLYAGDAKAFVGSGTVFRYESSGTALDNFTTGIGPNGFVFHN